MYRALKEKNPANKTTLVVGPWLHGGWARGDGDTLGDISLRRRRRRRTTATEIELPFFNFYLKDKGQTEPRAKPLSSRPAATGGMTTTMAADWHATAQPLPAGGGRLAFRLPPSGSIGRPAFDAYVSDPRKPVPYTAEVTTTEGHLFMVEDQRFVAGRPDVLVYETDAADGRPHHCRTDRRHAQRRHDRHRRRLGGQAHRRLSGRRAGSRRRIRITCGWAASRCCSPATSCARSSGTA